MSVSVVIPLFNRRDRIEGAIRSALDQRPKPLEIIVVDDGSSDIDDEAWLPAINSCVRVIRHEKNRGGAVARNTGIDAAKGDVIAFLDADDRWLPGKLQTQLAQIRGSSNVFACGNIRIDGGTWDGRLYNPRPPHPGEDISRYTLIHCCTLQTSTLLVPTVLARTIRFDERLKRHQDWDFVFRLIKNGAKFAYCHEPLATWWNEEDPNRVSKQKSIEPPLLWLRVGSAAIAKDAATAFYFRDVFGKHLKQRPFAALAMALRLALSDVGSTAWVLQRIPLLRRIPISGASP